MKGPRKRPSGRRPPRRTPSGWLPKPPKTHRHPEPSDEVDLSGDWTAELRVTAKPEALAKARALASEAMAAYAEGDYTKAAALAEEVKPMAPRSGRVRELLGLSYYQARSFKEAVRELLTFRRLTGLKDQNHVIADCYRALNREDRALEVVREVSKGEVSDEIWSELVIVSASIFGGRGEFERALAQIARGDLDPKEVQSHHLRLWYVRSDLQERAGQRDAARRGWERIYAEDPDFFDVAERLEAGGV